MLEVLGLDFNHVRIYYGADGIDTVVDPEGGSMWRVQMLGELPDGRGSRCPYCRGRGQCDGLEPDWYGVVDIIESQCFERNKGKLVQVAAMGCTQCCNGYIVVYWDGRFHGKYENAG